jgi:hypothetical protein
LALLAAGARSALFATEALAMMIVRMIAKRDILKTSDNL